MSEIITPQPLEWLGMRTEIRKINGVNLITLLKFDASDEMAEYQQMIDRIKFRVLEAYAGIQNLALFDPDLSIPSALQLAVFPRKQFEKLLFNGMENPQAWAQVCVRTLNKFCDTVVYDGSIATQLWDNYASMPANEQRELLHEVAHPLVNDSLPEQAREESIKKHLTYHEMVVELIPRILLAIQRKMPESTEFLLGLKPDNVLPLGVINECGYGCFPAKPLIVNPIYGGIFLSGLAAVDILGSGDLLEGTKYLIRSAQKSVNPAEVWDRLEQKGAKKKWLLSSTDSVVRGQQVLKSFISG